MKAERRGNEWKMGKEYLEKEKEKREWKKKIREEKKKRRMKRSNCRSWKKEDYKGKMRKEVNKEGTRSCRKKIKMKTEIRMREGDDKSEEIEGEKFALPFCRLYI
jgi:hypothetical protein